MSVSSSVGLLSSSSLDGRGLCDPGIKGGVSMMAYAERNEQTISGGSEVGTYRSIGGNASYLKTASLL